MKIDLPKTDKIRIVIIGGGFAGIEIAKKLAKEDVQVVLVDKNNFHCFQPLLYQVATAALEADSIVYPIRGIFNKQKNFFFRQSEVEAINTDEKFIKSGRRIIEYDYLVVATGATTNYFNNEGLSVSAMPMKSITEALDLKYLILQNFEKAVSLNNKRKLQGYLNYVVAGGGPTGVELAGALGELKKFVLPKDFPELDINSMNIYLVHSRDRVLPMLSDKSSAKAKKYLEDLGVTVVLNTRVLDIQGDYVQVNTAKDIIARTLMWTAGVQGNPVNGLNSEVIDKSNRILVDEFNRIKGYEDIFAIGDIACMISEDFPRGHPMVAPAAMQQGELLAKNIAAITKQKELTPFVYNDKGAMATIGKDKAVVEVGKVRLSGFIAWIIWMFVHLKSLVGYRNKMIATYNWIRGYFTSEKGIRAIIRPYEFMAHKKKRKKIFRKRGD
ncbi:MAG: FAD-dependent oxidoreductase [Flavobacteriales bacterium]|nr:MAG: FAD-dependent oxidoreductase [Flavobacteriales bacterium]